MPCHTALRRTVARAGFIGRDRTVSLDKTIRIHDTRAVFVHDDGAIHLRDFVQQLRRGFRIDLDATFRYSSLQAQLGDQEAAIGGLERMLFYNPDLPRVRLELGLLYFRLGSYEMARANFEAAIAGKNVPEDGVIRVRGLLKEIHRRGREPQFAFFRTAVLRRMHFWRAMTYSTWDGSHSLTTGMTR